MCNIFTDSLDRRFRLLTIAITDNIKFVGDAKEYSKAQAEINKVLEWANKHYLPFSVEKTSIMHGRRSHPLHTYALNGKVIKFAKSICDLVITCTSDKLYSEHCTAEAIMANRLTGAILPSFGSRAHYLMKTTFQKYRLCHH